MVIRKLLGLPKEIKIMDIITETGYVEILNPNVVIEKSCTSKSARVILSSAGVSQMNDLG